MVGRQNFLATQRVTPYKILSFTVVSFPAALAMVCDTGPGQMLAARSAHNGPEFARRRSDGSIRWNEA
jgi:hypothetical protein